MIVVVTALIGASGGPPPVGPQEPGVRYICITDRTDIPAGWERFPPPAATTPRLAARLAKTGVHAFFPTAEASIWMDASFDLIASPSAILAAAPGAITAFAHPDRCRILDEAREVTRLGLAPFDLVARQIKAYDAAGFDTEANPQRQLTTTGFMVRRHTPAVIAFNKAWRAEIEAHTLRDQLSVDYVARETGVSIDYFPGHYRDNAFVHYDRVRHRQRWAA